MTEKDAKSVADRRSFLKLASVGVVAGGAALIAGEEPAGAGVPESGSEGGKDRLYKETQHIKTYYDLARF